MNTNEGREAKAMELSAQSVIYLNDTRKWTLFFSILGFIFMGIMILGVIFMLTIFGSMSPMASPASGMGVMLAFFYLALGALYFFPIYYLFKFSTHSKNAIYSENSEQIELAFKFLRLHYKFIGILTIIILAIYVLIFIIAAIAGGLGAFM